MSSNQCWSESGLVSPAVSPSPQGQSPSPSPSPSDQSPSPSGVSPSPLNQSPSPSPSPLDQSPSPSPSPVGTSPSPSPRVQQKSEWVRTRSGLMSPTVEKCFISTLLLIIFAKWLHILIMILAQNWIDWYTEMCHFFLENLNNIWVYFPVALRHRGALVRALDSWLQGCGY